MKNKTSSKMIFISLTLLIVILVLVIPLANIFYYAFRDGVSGYITGIFDIYSLASMKLTLLIIVLTLPFTTIFGICAAWFVTKYNFRGKAILIALIDLPFAISPVIIGLMLVLLYGINSPIGEWLDQYNLQIIFSIPGIALATAFVTMPFVFREVLLVMESKGNSEEEAALSLGASLWTIFLKVTLPNIKWGVFYGAILAIARSIGEFGAVSVVSGHIIGRTNTMPLQVETYYNEYHFTSAFALASVMSIFAFVVIILKIYLEKRIEKKSQK